MSNAEAKTLRAPWAITAEGTRELMRVALGEVKADLAILGGSVANVYTGEVQRDCDIAIKANRIAYMGDCRHTIGPETRVIDATAKAVIPGLIDGHTHALNRYGPAELIRYTIPTGTTTIITEILELVFPLGLAAIDALLAAFRDQPIKLLATLPALASIDPPWPGITPTLSDYARYLNDDGVAGLGETYWANALRDDGRLLDLYAAMHGVRKPLEGHTAGARGPRLQAYMATGQSSCHEPIAVDEAIDRLRLGAHVMLRQGAIRDDLAVAAGIKDAGVDLRRLAVVSDSVEPSDLLDGKYMNAIVQKAIDLGFAPITAIQMGSLNVAEHFHLDYWLGGLAPGKCADLLIIPDIRRIEPEYVVSNGQVIAHEGRVLAEPRPISFPESFYHAIKLKPHYRAADFRIAAPGDVVECNVRAIDQITALVTQEWQGKVPVSNGELRAQPELDLIKVAAIERRKGDGEQFLGFVRGHGLARGAFATTMNWDSTALVVIGTNDEDMAGAVNHLIAMQGGAVVYAAGSVLADFPTRLGAFVSDAPLSEVTRAMAEVQTAVESLGSPHSKHILTLDTLTAAAIPHFRINHVGYYSLREGKTYGLFV